MKYLQKVLPLLLMMCFFMVVASTTFAAGEMRTIEIHARRYVFSPAEITLKKGETVKLRLISDDVAHSLVVPPRTVVRFLLSLFVHCSVLVCPSKSGAH